MHPARNATSTMVTPWALKSSGSQAQLAASMRLVNARALARDVVNTDREGSIPPA